MNKDKKTFYRALLVGGGFTLAIWLVFLVEWMAGLDFGGFGIRPRSFFGLGGIITGPFIHGDFAHIQSNSPPLLVLTMGLFYFYKEISWKTLLYIWIFTGIWVWAGARDASHIGASGVVFGLAAFIFFSGVFRRDGRAIALSLVVAFYYGGMFWGVLPMDPAVSFESHLFGALSGTILAWWFRKQAQVPRKKYSWEDEPDSDVGDERAIWNYQKKVIPPREFDEKAWKDPTDG